MDSAAARNGLRTIWHRGRTRTEMLSWENRDKEIVRQELSIFGMLVEYRDGQTLRTVEEIARYEHSIGRRRHSRQLRQQRDPTTVGRSFDVSEVEHGGRHILDRNGVGDLAARGARTGRIEYEWDGQQFVVKGMAVLVGVVLPELLAVIRGDDQQRTPWRLEGAKGLEDSRNLGIRVGEDRVMQASVGRPLLGCQIELAVEDAFVQIHFASALDLSRVLGAQQLFSKVSVG